MSCQTNTKRTAVVMNVCSDVNAAVVAASAIAESEPHNSQATVTRLYNQMRRTSVISAIRYELAKRNNEAVARRVSGFRPMLVMDCYERSMEHARAREVKLLDWLEVDSNKVL